MFKEKKWTLIVISTFLTVIVIIYILSYINNRDFEDFLNGIPIILTLVMFLVGYPVEEYTRKKWPAMSRISLFIHWSPVKNGH